MISLTAILILMIDIFNVLKTWRYRSKSVHYSL